MKLVLDTNVVLDWLHFAHPQLAILHDFVQRDRLTVVTHPLLSEELRRVLAYSQFKLDAAAQDVLLRRYETLTSPLVAGEAPDVLPEGFPRCRDPDDDKFLAVAFHARANALVSKDKALLKLRRRSSRLGFQILTVPALLEALNGNPG